MLKGTRLFFRAFPICPVSVARGIFCNEIILRSLSDCPGGTVIVCNEIGTGPRYEAAKPPGVICGMLEQVHDALWVAEGEIVSFFGFPYPTRSVIARLANGDLWVWSPVKLIADLRNEVDRLGSVRHLVSPNKLHHLYLQEWKAAYPEALLWGPLTTIKKRPDIKFRKR